MDEAERKVPLLLTSKRREQVPLAFTEIKPVSLKRVPYSARVVVFYAYTLTMQLVSGKAGCLMELNRKHAGAFAVWLKGKLGLPASP